VIKHTTKVKGVGFELDELAKRTGDLYYDDLAHFLEELSHKISSDAIADKARGRVKLAQNLSKSASLLQQSSKEMLKAWDRCKIHTIRWMIDNGFNKHDINLGVLEEEICREFSNRTRWDNVSFDDHDTRYDLANYDDVFTKEMLFPFKEQGRAYIEYLKTYLKVIASSDFYPEKVPESQEFIKEKCEEFGFLDDFRRYYRV